VMRDLIARITRIARMDREKRIQLIRAGTLDAAFPVTFRGVAPGLFRIAKGYAAEGNAMATYAAGARSVLAEAAARGMERSLPLRLRFANLCGEAGDPRLALVQLNESEQLLSEPSAGLRAAILRMRMKWLAVEFERLMQARETEKLWTLAKSQAGYALERADLRVMAQCISWMSVAALQAGNYELGKEMARDAIPIARKTRDRFREAFAHFYLGHAERELGNIAEASTAYFAALRLMPHRKFRPLHAGLMLCCAEVSEQLDAPRGPVLQLYRAAFDLADGLGEADPRQAAEDGIARLTSHVM